MDTTIERLRIAQVLVQNLVTLPAARQRPTHGQVQAVLDQAAAQLKALDAQPPAPQPPLNVPNLVPPQTTNAPAANS
jgi:hypothetical protein